MKTLIKWKIRKVLLKAFEHPCLGVWLRKMDDFFDARRKGPIRILFVIRNQFGFVFQYPLMQHLTQNPCFEIRYTVDERGNQFDFPDDFTQQGYEQYFIHSNRAIFCKWDYVIHAAWPSLHFQRTTIQAYLPHGLSFGNKDYAIKMAKHPRIQVYFGLSENEQAFIEEHAPQVYRSPKRLFFSVGSPFLDELLELKKSSYDITKLKQKRGIEASQKVVLISSTWGDDSLFAQLGVDWIDEFTKHVEGQVIATGHEFLWAGRSRTKPSPRHDLMAKLTQIEKRNPNFRFIPHEHIASLFPLADILIGDHSAALPPYCLFKKPILFFDAPNHSFSSEEAYQHYLRAMDSFQSVEQLLEQYDRVSQETNQKGEEQEKLCEFFFSNLGRSCELISNILIEMGRASRVTPLTWTTMKEKWGKSYSSKKRDHGVLEKCALSSE